MVLGNQFGTVQVYNTLPIFVDLLKQGIFSHVDGRRVCTIDTKDGYPSEDFRWVHQWINVESEGRGHDYTWIVEGNPGKVGVDLANGWTLVSVNYHAGTDTARIVTRAPKATDWRGAPIRLTFTGTRRTPASPVGSGVRSIKMIRRGYEAKPNQNLTDELIGMVADFEELRFMKAQHSELDVLTTGWANAPRRTTRRMVYNYDAAGTGVYWDAWEGKASQGLAIEDIVDICNAANTHCWIVVPNHADGTWEAGFAAYAEANLKPGLTVTYEWANEAWNPGYESWWHTVNAAARELNGFWQDPWGRSKRFFTAASVTNNVLTLTMNEAHGLTTGHVLYGNFGKVDALYPVTVLGPTQYSIPYRHASGDILAELSNSTTGFNANGSDTSVVSVLNAGASLADITYWSPIGTRRRWYTRRAMQMSDNVRAVVGDRLMMTRHNPTLQQQMPVLSYYFDMIDFCERIMRKRLSDKFRAFGGGGYFFGVSNAGVNVGTDYSVPHTKEEMLAVYMESGVRAKREYIYDNLKVLALQKGVELWNYEGGPDMKSYPNGTGPHTRENAIAKKEATYDPMWTRVIETFVREQAIFGCDKYIEFNLELNGRYDYSGGGNWGMTYDPTVVSPQWQAYKNFVADRPKHTHNVVPGTVDARAFLGEFGDLSAKPYPTLSSSFLVWQNDKRTTGTLYFPTVRDRLQYLVFTAAAGDMRISIAYRTLKTAARFVWITLNGTTVGIIPLPSLGAGSIGLSVASLTLPMRKGANAVEIARDGDNADFELRALRFSSETQADRAPLRPGR
jgi:hypothetical protein